MTEDEAKTKWCFQTKRDVEAHDELGTIRCIGSACMAWRWTRPEWTPTSKPIPADGKMRWYDTSGNETAPPRSDIDGHCGLAGKS